MATTHERNRRTLLEQAMNQAILDLEFVRLRRSRRAMKKPQKQKKYTLAALAKLWNVPKERILLTMQELKLIVPDEVQK